MDVRKLSNEQLHKLVFDTKEHRSNSGLLGAARGEYTERRVLGLTRACRGVRTARRAPQSHDQLGVDIIVELCDGRTRWVQVKSSNGRRSNPATKKAERNGAVVVCIPVNLSDADAKHRIRIALGLAIAHPFHAVTCAAISKKRKSRAAWRARHRKRARKKWREKKRAMEVRVAGMALMRWEDDGGRPIGE